MRIRPVWSWHPISAYRQLDMAEYDREQQMTWCIMQSHRFCHRLFRKFICDRHTLRRLTYLYKSACVQDDLNLSISHMVSYKVLQSVLCLYHFTRDGDSPCPDVIFKEPLRGTSKTVVGFWRSPTIHHVYVERAINDFKCSNLRVK